MTKAELESKHLADLHELAAEAGVERYRMLTRAELVERLATGGAAAGGEKPAARGGEERRRPPRRRRDGGSAEESAEPTAPPAPAASAAPASESTTAEPPRSRRRRRRRFGRRSKGVNLPGLLLPPQAGRQALLCAESRGACTALLRGVAAELAAAAKGPDPVALLIDPSPEELADWKRDAPQAEIVAAGQPRHADDALGQAAARAAAGEDVILLVDSLTRLAEAYGDPEAAKEFFDAGRTPAAAGSGTLTVVAALERP